MESQLEKEARFCQLMAHSSHDSAIDTDSLEWETEVVEFEKDRVREQCSALITESDPGDTPARLLRAGGALKTAKS